MNIDLKNAFPAMTDRETDALMDAARSVREEERSMKKKLPKGMLIFAIVALLTVTVAVAEGLRFNLLEELFNRFSITVLPGVETAENVLQVENEYCIFTIREAAFDGFGGSVIVDIQAKDEKTLLTSDWGATLDEPAAHALYGTCDREDQTIGEYAAEHGYKQCVGISVDFPRAPTTRNSITGAALQCDFNGNQATVVMTFSTPNADIKQSQLTLEYCFYAFPRFAKKTIRAEIDAYLQVCQGEFALTVEEPLWTRKAAWSGQTFNGGMYLKDLTLTGTKLSTYMVVAYDFRAYVGNSSDKNDYIFSLGTGDGRRLSRGMAQVADKYTPTWGEEGYIYTISFEPLETPPGLNDLWLYVTNLDKDITQQIQLQLIEE